MGVVAGAGMAAIIGENPLKKDGEAIFHWSTGLTGRLGLGPLALQPEVMYSKKGVAITAFDEVTLEQMGVETLGQRTSHIDINLPLSVGVLPKVDVLIGAQFSYLLDAEGYYTPIGGDEVKSDRTKVNNALEVGGILGAQFEIMDGFFLGARSTLGFTNINNKDETYYSRFNEYSGIGQVNQNPELSDEEKAGGIAQAKEYAANTPGDDSYNVNWTYKAFISYLF